MYIASFAYFQQQLLSSIRISRISHVDRHLHATHFFIAVPKIRFNRFVKSLWIISFE